MGFLQFTNLYVRQKGFCRQNWIQNRLNCRIVQRIIANVNWWNDSENGEICDHSLQSFTEAKGKTKEWNAEEVCFLNNVQSSNGYQLSFWKVSVISHSERQKDDFIYSVFTNYRCLFHLKYRCMTPKLSRLIRGFEVNVEFERTINYQSENETPFYVWSLRSW